MQGKTKMASSNKLLRGLRGVLIDLSGTIHIENVSVIPRSIEALKKLRHSGLPFRFITNSTVESKQTLLKGLTNLGFDITPDEVFTSLTATAHLVQKRNLRPMLLLESDAIKDFNGIDTSNPNAVVVGSCEKCFNYETLTQAFRLLMEGHPLIGIHKGRYYKGEDGLGLGPGPFVTALEYASDVKAELVGKPEPLFFQHALENIRCDAQSAVMIGDDVRDDVGGAQAVGMKGILVKTGKYRPGDEDKLSQPPHAICDDFSSAVDHILENLEETRKD